MIQPGKPLSTTGGAANMGFRLRESGQVGVILPLWLQKKIGLNGGPNERIY